MACPLCGPQCTCIVPASAHAMSALAHRDALATFFAHSSSSGYEQYSRGSRDGAGLDRAIMHPEYANCSEDSDNEIWRGEVASRVNSYRARRGRKIGGDFSMKLDFDAPPATLASALVERAVAPDVCDTNYYRRANAEAMSAAATAPALPASEPAYDPDFDFTEQPEASAPSLEAMVADEVAEPSVVEDVKAVVSSSHVEEPVAPPEPAPRPVTKVIAFPKPLIEPPLVAPAPRDQLAEPVFDSPRILDVPEDNVPTIQGPLFADIHLDSDTDIEAAEPRASKFEVPLQVALLPQRIFAAIVDWLVVLAGTAVFAAVSWTWLAEFPHTKPMLMATAAVPVLIWAVYQFLFIVYAGRTFGMEVARLRLCRFDGQRPGWRDRKERAVVTMLSLVSVGFGFLWALVDEDTLCWHDRATRTYITPQ